MNQRAYKQQNIYIKSGTIGIGSLSYILAEHDNFQVKIK